MDNSGKWGSGGFFNAVRALSADVEKNYEQAHKMKDLHLGDVHLIPVGSRDDTRTCFFNSNVFNTRY